MTTAIFIKEGIQLGLVYSFRGLVNEHNDRYGRHGAREGAESSTFGTTGNRKKETLGPSLLGF